MPALSGEIRMVLFNNPIISRIWSPTSFTGETSDVKFLKKGRPLSEATTTISINGIGTLMGVQHAGVSLWIYDIDETTLG